MSAPRFKPGDVAMVTYDNASLANKRRGKSDVVAQIAVRTNDWWAMGRGQGLDDSQIADPLVAAEIRPLVVIDPEDREQVERLLRAYWTTSDPAGEPDVENYPGYLDDLQAALRSLVTPPRPDEPQGLGAVVEDATGDVWTRCRRPRAKGVLGVEWENERTCGHERWQQVAAVRVLSEGWSE